MTSFSSGCSGAGAASSTASNIPNASSLFSVVGKNVVVTGGSRGIGWMIAKGFAQAGANVLLTSRDEKACAQAASQLSCQYVTSNVSTREGCQQFAKEVSRIFDGNLHVLVNNVCIQSTLQNTYFGVPQH